MISLLNFLMDKNICSKLIFSSYSRTVKYHCSACQNTQLTKQQCTIWTIIFTRTLKYVLTVQRKSDTLQVQIMKRIMIINRKLVIKKIKLADSIHFMQGNVCWTREIHAKKKK